MNALVQPIAGIPLGSTSELRPIKKVPARPCGTWTEEMDAVLIDMHKTEASFSAIGAALGVSRNAAIGRAHRIGLPGRAEARGWRKGIRAPSAPLTVKPPRTASGSEPKRGLSGLIKRAKPMRPALPKPQLHLICEATPAAPESRMVPIWELGPNDCRFIFGDPADIGSVRYCGADKRKDSSYCCSHHTLCYKVTERTRPDLVFSTRKNLIPSRQMIVAISDREDAT